MSTARLIAGSSSSKRFCTTQAKMKFTRQQPTTLLALLSMATTALSFAMARLVQVKPIQWLEAQQSSNTEASCQEQSVKSTHCVLRSLTRQSQLKSVTLKYTTNAFEICWILNLNKTFKFQKTLVEGCLSKACSKTSAILRRMRLIVCSKEIWIARLEGTCLILNLRDLIASLQLISSRAHVWNPVTKLFTASSH